MAFYPWRPVATGPVQRREARQAVGLDRDTGEVLREGTDTSYPALGEVTSDRVFFSPDGQHLLLECVAGSERFLRRVVLRLK